MTLRPIGRRSFLSGGARAVASAGVVALTGCTTGTDVEGRNSTSAATALDFRSWEGVRAMFALDREVAHFAAFVMASHPANVRAAIEKWREALDADAATVVSNETEHDEAVRTAAARYLSVAPDEIALTDSTTMGLGLTYNGLRLSSGDHILTSAHDFYSTHESLRLAAARSEAEVEQVGLYNDPASASTDQIVSLVRAAIRPATRVVALTWVHSSTGVKIPVREIGDMLEEINATRDPPDRVLYCLDAVHGFGAEDGAARALGCDVLISGTHKWLFGPRGTGLIWARRDVWDRLVPIIPTFSGPSIGRWLFGERASLIFGLDGTPGGYHSFEHRWALADAFDFHLSIGKGRIMDRTQELATRLKDGLSEIPGVRLITPRAVELSAGIVCCEVTGREPDEVVKVLRHKYKIVASVTPYRQRYVRFGPSIVTMPEEVDAAVRAMAELA